MNEKEEKTQEEVEEALTVWDKYWHLLNEASRCKDTTIITTKSDDKLAVSLEDVQRLVDIMKKYEINTLGELLDQIENTEKLAKSIIERTMKND